MDWQQHSALESSVVLLFLFAAAVVACIEHVIAGRTHSIGSAIPVSFPRHACSDPSIRVSAIDD